MVYQPSQTAGTHLAAEGFALSMAKRVLQGRGEQVVETITHNLRLRP
jgi:hypothetical protein